MSEHNESLEERFARIRSGIESDAAVVRDLAQRRLAEAEAILRDVHPSFAKHLQPSSCSDTVSSKSAETAPAPSDSDSAFRKSTTSATPFKQAMRRLAIPLVVALLVLFGVAWWLFPAPTIVGHPLPPLPLKDRLVGMTIQGIFYSIF